jgi:hypothetical protein
LFGAPRFGVDELGVKCARQARDDFVLHVEEISELLIEPLGPEMIARLRVVKLHVDAYAVSAALDAAFKDIAKSGTALDRLLVDLLDRWRAAETTAGVSIGVREIAFVLALDPDIRGRVQVSTGLPQSLTPAEAAQVLANLLWPRGLEISQRALQSYNRFADRRSTDPRLARALLQRAGRRVSFGAPGWGDDLARSLAQEGAAELFGNVEDLAGLRAAVLEALTTPIDVGFLQFFPKIERTERRADGLVIALVVQEQI